MKNKSKNLENLINLIKKIYFNKKQGLHDPLFSGKENYLIALKVDMFHLLENM